MKMIHQIKNKNNININLIEQTSNITYINESQYLIIIIYKFNNYLNKNIILNTINILLKNLSFINLKNEIIFIFSFILMVPESSLSKNSKVFNTSDYQEFFLLLLKISNLYLNNYIIYKYYK